MRWPREIARIKAIKGMVTWFEMNWREGAHFAVFFPVIAAANGGTIRQASSLERIDRCRSWRTKDEDFACDSGENRLFALLDEVVDDSKMNLYDGTT